MVESTAQVNGGVNIFATVNPITGRTYDFRHVGPHAVKSGSGKRAAITCPGNRDIPILSLLPETDKHISFPVSAAGTYKTRIQRFFERPPRAFLDTSETISADHGVRICHLPRVVLTAFVCFVNTYFGTFTAINAVFSPHYLEFENIVHVEGRGFGVNVIFLGHNLYPSFLILFISGGLVVPLYHIPVLFGGIDLFQEFLDLSFRPLELFFEPRFQGIPEVHQLEVSLTYLLAGLTAHAHESRICLFLSHLLPGQEFLGQGYFPFGSIGFIPGN